MPETYFKLIFNGQISPDSEIHAVKRNLCVLLKVNLSKVETMFDGRTRILKRQISRADANRYKEIFDKTGAVSIIEPANDAESLSIVQLQSTVNENTISCPKCGTVQIKTPTCIRCGVIFDKLAAHSERQAPDKQQITEVVPDGNQTRKTVLPGTRAYCVALSILTIIGCCALAYSSVNLVKTATFLNSSQTATGNVIGFAASHRTGGGPRSTTYAPLINFRAPDGRQISFRSKLSSNVVTYYAGEQVSVRFDPTNPYHAEINAFMPLWGVGIITLLMGSFLTWVGWRMLGIHRKAKLLNFEEYAQGRSLFSSLMFCPTCGVQQPPSAVCKFCQADMNG